MKKFILALILGIVSLVSFNSCVTEAYAQDVEVSTDDFSIVVRYGTPYYYDGSILYYMYNGWYYYPYVLNNRYYYHRYSRPLHYYNHRYINNSRVYRRSSTYYHHRPHIHRGGDVHHRGGVINHRPNINNHRPNINHGPSINRGGARPHFNGGSINRGHMNGHHGGGRPGNRR